MPSINVFTIVGNLVRDVELRHTPNGTPVAMFTVAVSNVFYDRQGGRREETDYVPVTTFGKQAENDAKFLKKGYAVGVVGRIRSWYRADERKGGFNFEAGTVQYLGRPTGARAGSEGEPSQDYGNSEHEEWLRDYSSSPDQGERL